MTYDEVVALMGEPPRMGEPPSVKTIGENSDQYTSFSAMWERDAIHVWVRFNVPGRQVLEKEIHPVTRDWWYRVQRFLGRWGL
jgi:hypothetical protein